MIEEILKTDFGEPTPTLEGYEKVARETKAETKSTTEGGATDKPKDGEL